MPKTIAEAWSAAMPEALSLPAAKVSPLDTGCQHQLVHHSQAQHLPGEVQFGRHDGHLCHFRTRHAMLLPIVPVFFAPFSINDPLGLLAELVCIVKSFSALTHVSLLQHQSLQNLESILQQAVMLNHNGHAIQAACTPSLVAKQLMVVTYTSARFTMPDTVQAFLLAAMKFHCYMKALPVRSQADSELAWLVIQQGIEYFCNLIRARVWGAQTRWCSCVLLIG